MLLDVRKHREHWTAVWYGNFRSKWHRHAVGIGNVIMSNSTPYRNHRAEQTAESHANISYHNAIVRWTGNFQETVPLWRRGRVYRDAEASSELVLQEQVRDRQYL